MTDETAKPERDERLARLRPRDISAAKSRSAAYSRAVGAARGVLLGGVVLAVAALVIWPMVRSHKLAEVVTEHAPDLVVDHLNLTGLDQDNQAYAVRAVRALQVRGADNKNTVDLEKPEGEISLKNGSWLAARASLGRLDQANKRLWLGGGVEIFHDQGYRFLTDEMFADMGKSTAWGAKPVLIQGSFGEIRGTGFRFLEGGKIFLVTGPASAHLDLRAAKGSGKPSGKNSPSR